MTGWVSSRTARFVVPQLFTATRLVVSGIALLAAVERDFLLASRLVVIGVVVDSFDGPIAKRLKVTSDFGVLFDYFGDYLGNVVVPSLLVFLILDEQVGPLAIVVAVTPLLAGGIRYARNAVLTQATPFEQAGYPGLGTVFFAIFMVEMVMLDVGGRMGEATFGPIVLAATVIFSLSMVGWWRYPKLTKSLLVNVTACGLLIVHLFAFTNTLGSIVLIGIVGYGLFGPIVMRVTSRGHPPTRPSRPQSAE